MRSHKYGIGSKFKIYRPQVSGNGSSSTSYYEIIELTETGYIVKGAYGVDERKIDWVESKNFTKIVPVEVEY